LYVSQKKVKTIWLDFNWSYRMFAHRSNI